MLDPFNALATFALGKMRDSMIGQWFRLLFTMTFSAIVSYLLTTGGALTSGLPEPISKGLGMVMAGVVMTALYRRSPLTKGMTIVLPASEAEKELNTSLQTIERTK